MPSSNPLFRGGWSLRKFNSTVINDIWPEVLFFSGVAAMVATVTKLTTHNLSIPSDLLGVLGTVLGLVISFRTSSAYERYTEGRKLWTSIQISSRTLAQLIWVFVPLERQTLPNGQRAQTKLQSVIEKKSMINLVQAFSVGLKHFLRSEPGIYYEDLYPLLSFLPRYGSKNPAVHGADDLLPLWHASEEDELKLDHAQLRPAAMSHPTQATLVGSSSGSNSDKESTSWYSSVGKKRSSRCALNDPEMGYLPSVHVHRPLRPARNPPNSGILDYLPFLRIFTWIGGLFYKRAQDVASMVGVTERNALGKKKKRALVDSNVPVEVCMYLLSYANYLVNAGLVQGPIFASMTSQVGTLQDTLSNLERIRSTPLPFAYQAHLRMSLWLYLFFLPFQIVKTFQWLTIPGTAFAAFCLLGFLEIGAEIEDPFGYDENDLDLDGFCLALQRELHEITVHDAPHPLDYMFSSWNQPFAPADRRAADELCKEPDYAHTHPAGGVEPGMDSIKRTLLQSWKDVDQKTRNLKI